MTNLHLILPRFALTKSARYCVAVLLLVLALPTPALPTKPPRSLKKTNPSRVAVSAQKLEAIDGEVESE
ncbi:MAG: hypothetical protein ACXW3C_11840, partial [Pyrinomonadaceae bacterium]